MGQDDSKPKGEAPPETPKWVGTLKIYETTASADVRKPEKEKSEEPDRPLTRYERRSLNTQILIFLITAVYAGFAYLQWDAIKRTVRYAEGARLFVG
jgi:hypothetical protein